MMHDLRTSIYYLHEECLRNNGLEQLASATSGRNWGAAAEEDASGEQQLKRTQMGSSSS